MKIADRDIKIPLLQGGMGIGISLGGLAGAVAKEGAVGMISAAQPGFLEENFFRNPLEANLRAMGKELRKARKTAPEGAIGFNIMVAMNHYKEYVQEAVRLGADLIVSGAGLPVNLPAYVQEAVNAAVEEEQTIRAEEGGVPAGKIPGLVPIVSSEKSAQVILKYWDRKYHCTADAVVIEGPLAGGHLGFSRDQVKTYLEEGMDSYEAEIQKTIAVIRNYEERYKRKIPVFVAGGMDSHGALCRMQQLGADGIQTASRFVTTKECDAAPAYKQSYLEAEEKDIVLIQSPVGMPGRAINNTFVKETGAGIRKAPAHCTHCLAHCNPKETFYCITEALVRAAKGDTENGLLFCGGNTGKQKKIETVKEVIDSLMGVSL